MCRCGQTLDAHLPCRRDHVGKPGVPGGLTGCETLVARLGTDDRRRGMQLLPGDLDTVIHHRGRSCSEDEPAGNAMTGISGHLAGGLVAPGTVTIPGGRTACYIAD